MCAALFNAKYASAASMYAVSAGLYADSSKISDNAVLVLSDMGIVSDEVNPYRNHVSHTVTAQDMEEAYAVYGVSSKHAEQLKMRFPEYASKIYSFSEPIADPYGGDAEEYRKCLGDIDAAMSVLFSSEDRTADSPVVIADESMLGEIFAIETASFTCPWTEKSLLDAIKSKNVTVYAALDENGSAAGFSCLLVIGSEAELLNIAVSPVHRRKGYADVLFGRMLCDLIEKEVEAVYLEVRFSNTPAQKLYEKYGFEKLGLRKKYYTNPSEDAVLMKKTIDLT